jgi:hypothetical protein
MIRREANQNSQDSERLFVKGDIMGHKGVSKRKPSLKKTKPLSGDHASGSVSEALQAIDHQPVKSPDTTSEKGGANPTTGRKRRPNKG